MHGKERGVWRVSPVHAQVRAAAEHMATYLASNWQPCASAWAQRHKHQLRSSALILQAWLHSPSAALVRLQGDKSRCHPFRPAAGTL